MLSLIVNQDNYDKVVVIHPIFDIIGGRDRISIKNIVTLPYLRGFAYKDEIGILYTGVGCHKVPGILIAIDTTNIGGVLSNIFQPTCSKITAIYDVALDYFSAERIDMREFNDVLGRIDRSLKVDRCPVITSVGELTYEELYAREVRYEKYEDILERFLHTINDFISYDQDQNNKYSIRKIIRILDNQDDQRRQKRRRIHLICLETQNNRKRLVDLNLGDITEIYETPNEDTLRSRIREIFITSPKRIQA